MIGGEITEEDFLYYKYDKAEFPNSYEYGEIITEFQNGYATRQINILKNKYFASSSLKENDGQGRGLYDGHINEMDLSESVRITHEEFEKYWIKALELDDKKSQINYTKGDASIPFDNRTLIVHVVDVKGMWGKGFVLSLSKKFPDSKRMYLKWFESKEYFDLGNVQFVFADKEEIVYIANMLAQIGVKKNFKDKNKYLDYDALRICLRKAARFAMYNRLSIQMPKIGSGLGGGEWIEIEKIINEEIIYNKISCTIFEL